MSDIDIVKFCAEECNRQESGELSVYHMYDAYMWLYTEWRKFPPYAHTQLTLDAVNTLAFRVDPRNVSYRLIPVTFGGIVDGVPPQNISRALKSLIASAEHMHANELYQEFERIHPYIDGNGRIGAILFNFKLQSLDSPVTPPEFEYGVTA